MTTRVLRPRATDRLVVAPVLVTDRTAAAVLGLEPREYRELVAREHVPHARRGQRLIARIEDVLLAIDRLASASSASETSAPVSAESFDEDDGGGVDAILARIGRRRVA